MKLSLERLAQHLQQQLAPCYWLSGDEPLLMDEALGAVRQAAYAAGYQERIVWHVDAGFDWQQLTLEVNNLSLFSTQQVIELNLVNLKLNPTAIQALQSVILQPPSDKLFVIRSPKLENKILNSAWYKSITTKLVEVPIWPISQAQMPVWLKQRLQQAHFEADADAIELLAEYSCGNLLAAAQEITKLQLLYGSGKLTVEAMISAITDNARYSIFQLSEYILTGKASQISRIICHLSQGATDAILVLWVLIRDLRFILSIVEKQSQGLTATQALQQVPLPASHKSSLAHYLHRNPQLAWQDFLVWANRIDRIIKGIEPGNTWQELTQLALAMAGITMLSPSRAQTALKLGR